MRLQDRCQECYLYGDECVCGTGAISLERLRMQRGREQLERQFEEALVRMMNGEEPRWPGEN